jgi:hypothetical protein
MKKITIASLAILVALAFGAPGVRAEPRGRVSFSASPRGISISAGRSSRHGSVSFSVGSPRVSRYHYSGWTRPYTYNNCAPTYYSPRPYVHYSPRPYYPRPYVNYSPRPYYPRPQATVSYHHSYDSYPSQYVNYSRSSYRDGDRRDSRHDSYYSNSGYRSGSSRHDSGRRVYYSSCD